MRQLLLAIVVFAASPALAAGRSATPPRPPPRLHQQGPPPAWVETQSRSVWLAFSSYCWSQGVGSNHAAICADMIPPQSRTDLPVLSVARGRPLRFHLSFLPREVHLTLFRPRSFSHYVLQPGRIVAWHATGSGILSLEIRSASGSAAYLVRLNVR